MWRETPGRGQGSSRAAALPRWSAHRHAAAHLDLDPVRQGHVGAADPAGRLALGFVGAAAFDRAEGHALMRPPQSAYPATQPIRPNPATCPPGPADREELKEAWCYARAGLKFFRAVHDWCHRMSRNCQTGSVESNTTANRFVSLEEASRYVSTRPAARPAV